MTRYVASALVLVALGCGEPPHVYRVREDRTLGDASAAVPLPAAGVPLGYARIRVRATPTARPFLTNGVATLRVVSGAYEATRTFTAAQALAPDSREPWFVDVPVPVAESGVVRLWMSVSVIKDAGAGKMPQIADAVERLMTAIPPVAPFAAASKGVYELAAAMFDAQVDRTYVQAFDLSFGARCAPTTSYCLAASGEDVFVAVWGVEAREAGRLNLTGGVLYDRGGRPSSRPAIVLEVSRAALPREVFTPKANEAIEAAARGDGVALDESAIQPPRAGRHLPALRRFALAFTAARAKGLANDAEAEAVVALLDWKARDCGTELDPASTPCEAASRLAERHLTANPDLKRLAEVLRDWKAVAASAALRTADDGDPCQALRDLSPRFTAAEASTTQLLEQRPELTVPALRDLRRATTGAFTDFAEACYAQNLRAASERDPDLRAVFGSIGPAQVKNGNVHLAVRVGMVPGLLEKISGAVSAAQAAVPAKVPSVQAFSSLVRSQASELAALFAASKDRDEVVVTVMRAYLADAVQAARPFAVEPDVSALLDEAAASAALPDGQAALKAMPARLIRLREALLHAVAAHEELQQRRDRQDAAAQPAATPASAEQKAGAANVKASTGAESAGGRT